MRPIRFAKTFAMALAASGVFLVPALADELVGRIMSVDVSAKKLVVKEKGTDKEVDVTVTDDTVLERGEGKSAPLDLEKLQKNVEKAKKGVAVEITHDKGVASKIVRKAAPKKKAEPQD